jgi:hypothetical protein
MALSWASYDHRNHCGRWPARSSLGPVPALLLVAGLLAPGANRGLAGSYPTDMLPASEGCLRLDLVGQAWGRPGEFDTGYQLVARDNLAAVADTASIRLVDVTYPENPRVLGQVGLSGVERMAFVGPRLVALANGTLHMVDIAVPAAPTVDPLAMADAWTFSMVAALDDHHLIGLGTPPTRSLSADPEWAAANGGPALVILDLSSSPARTRWTVLLPDARAMAVGDGWAYAESMGRLQVIDVRDPARATIVSSVDLPSAFHQQLTEVHVLAGRRTLMVTADSPYVIDSPAEHTTLAFVDVRDRPRPSVTRHIVVPGHSHAIQLDEDLRLVAVGDALMAIDASDPAAPEAVTVWMARGGPYVSAGVIAGGRLLETGSGRLLKVYDLGRYEPCTREPALESPPTARPSGTRLALPLVLKSRFQRPQTMRDGDRLAQRGGMVWSAFLRGHTAFLGVGSGLSVVDLSNPDVPRTLAEGVPLLEPATQLTAAGPVLYAVSGAGAVQAFDIANPAHPRELARLRVQDGVISAGVAGQHLLVGSSHAVTVIDVSQPAAPRPLRSVFPPSPAVSYAVAGDRLYALMAVRQIWQYDPQRQIAHTGGYLSIQGGSYVALAGTDERLYVSTGDRLDVYRTSGDYGPSLFSSTELSLRRIVLAGTALYGLDSASRPVLITLADRDHPRVVAQLDAGRWLSLAGSADRLVLSALIAPAQVVDTTLLDQPRLATELVPPWFPANVLAIDDEVAYVSTLETGPFSETWHVVDYSRPGAIEDLGPLLGGSRGAGSLSQEAYRQGNIVYVVARVTAGDQAVVDVLDVTEPRRPRLVASLPLTGTEVVARVTGDGQRLYIWRRSLSREDDRIEILDPADPSPGRVLARIGPLSTQRSSAALAASAGYLYAGDASGIAVYDVRDPAAPSLVGHQGLPGGAVELRVDGNRLYALTNPGFVSSNYAPPARLLTILSLDQPTAPMPLGATIAGLTVGDFTYTSQLAVANGIAVVSAPSLGVDIVDVRDPTRPRRIAEWPAVGANNAVSIAGSRLLVAADYAGLVIDDLGGLVPLPPLPALALSASPRHDLRRRDQD